MKKLLFVGDAGCQSGFARATHAILDTVHKHYDTTVLAINFFGDADVQESFPYPLYAAIAGGDFFGTGRLLWMVNKFRPDVIVIQQDGWNIQAYVQVLRACKPNGEHRFPEFAAIPIVAAVAVDGKNFRAEWLDTIDLAVFWTEFALNEARLGGYRGEAVVIPLGVDLDVFRPMDRGYINDRFKALGIADKFVVGNINRNQPRKRWDLTLRFFAEWVRTRNVPDAYLMLHAAPTGDAGIDVKQMIGYYGLLGRVGLSEPMPLYGPTDDEVCAMYNAFDAQITTTQGEGFGLTTFEGMACGVPQIVPDWSALGELTKGAAVQVPCTSIAINPVAPDLNVIGGVPDERAFLSALDALYGDRGHRELVAKLGRELVEQPQYRWANVGERWVEALDSIFAPKQPEVWQDLSGTSAEWEDLGRPAEKQEVAP